MIIIIFVIAFVRFASSASLGLPPPSSPGSAGSCSNDGEEYSNSVFWFKCEKDGDADGPVAKVIGCAAQDDPPADGSSSNGHPVSSGQTFHLSDKVILCLYDDSADTWTQKAVGCVVGSKRSEHKAGEEWEDSDVSGDPRIKYKMRCQQDGYTVTKKAVQCVYNGDDGQGALDGGCMKKFGNTLVQCQKKQKDSGEYLRAQVVIAPNEQVESDAADLGVKYC